MAKIKCKGTVLSQDIAGTYTAIAQVLSIDESGAEVKTFDSTSLDSGTFETKSVTGYSAPGELSAELFWDPALSGHQLLTDGLATPAEKNYRVTYADAGTTQKTFAACGIAFGYKVAMGDGLKATVKLPITGDPGYPT